MLVRALIQKLFLQQRLYILFKYLSPLLMILSLVSIGYIIKITQTYEYQEPSMRKIITDIPSKYSIYLNQTDQSIFPIWQKEAIQFFGNIKINIIHGMLSYQTILISAPCEDHISNALFDQLQKTLKIKQAKASTPHLIKNIGLMCYKNKSGLEDFINILSSEKWSLEVENLSQQQTKTLQNLGIIRNVINMQFLQSKKQNRKVNIVFQNYDSQSLVATDVDFYQFIKENLLQLSLKWAPCEEALQANNYVYRWVRKNTQFYRENKQLTNYLFCQFQRLFDSQQNVNHIFISKGIPAVSLKIFIDRMSSQGTFSMTQKIFKLLYTYTYVFSFFQDHLHSSNTLYYPLNQLKYIQIKSYFIPGAMFITAAGIWVITKTGFIFSKSQKSFNKNSANKQQQIKFLKNTSNLTAIKLSPIKFGIILSIWITANQLYFFNTIKYSFWGTFILRLIFSIKSRQNTSSDQLKIIHIALILANMTMLILFMMSSLPLEIYTVVVCLTLSFSTPKQAIFLMFIIILFPFISSSSVDFNNLLGYVSKVQYFSNNLYVILMPISIWGTLR